MVKTVKLVGRVVAKALEIRPVLLRLERRFHTVAPASGRVWATWCVWSKIPGRRLSAREPNSGSIATTAGRLSRPTIPA